MQCAVCWKSEWIFLCLPYILLFSCYFLVCYRFPTLPVPQFLLSVHFFSKEGEVFLDSCFASRNLKHFSGQTTWFCPSVHSTFSPLPSRTEQFEQFFFIISTVLQKHTSLPTVTQLSGLMIRHNLFTWLVIWSIIWQVQPRMWDSATSTKKIWLLPRLQRKMTKVILFLFSVL